MALWLGAYAGYMAYKKVKAEREAQERLGEAEQSDQRETTPDDGESSSSSHDGGISASFRKVPQNGDKPVGPMGKFLLFCENLEKEVQKAQERKRRQVIDEAFSEASHETFGKKPKGPTSYPDVQAVSTMDSTDSSISKEEVMIEESDLDQPENRELVSDYSAEAKTQTSKIPSFSTHGFDDQHQILAKSMGSTFNRPRISTE